MSLVKSIQFSIDSQVKYRVSLLCDHVIMKTVLPDQEGPSDGTCNELEMFSTRELAYYITLIDWDLFCSVHEVTTAVLNFIPIFD